MTRVSKEGLSAKRSFWLEWWPLWVVSILVPPIGVIVFPLAIAYALIRFAMKLGSLGQKSVKGSSAKKHDETAGYLAPSQSAITKPASGSSGMHILDLFLLTPVLLIIIFATALITAVIPPLMPLGVPAIIVMVVLIMNRRN
jgi:hypothetical protein